MVNHLYYSYLLWMIVFFSLNLPILACNKTTMANSNHNSTWSQWIWTQLNSFVSVFIGILISSLVNYYQLKYIKSYIESSKEHLLNTHSVNIQMKTYRKRKILSEFIPIKPYKSFYIDEMTTPIALEKLICEIKGINRITIIPSDPWSSNEPITQIELIKQSFSIQIIIRSSLQPHVISPKLTELLSIIFQSSTTIQTWSKSNKGLLLLRARPSHLFPLYSTCLGLSHFLFSFLYFPFL